MDIIRIPIIGLIRTMAIRTMATIMGLRSIGTADIDITTATTVIIGTITGTKLT